MKDLMSEFEFYALWLKHFVYWGESSLGVIENSYFLWGSERKCIKLKKTPPLPSLTLLMKGP